MFLSTWVHGTSYNLALRRIYHMGEWARRSGRRSGRSATHSRNTLGTPFTLRLQLVVVAVHNLLQEIIRILLKPIGSVVSYFVSHTRLGYCWRHVIHFVVMRYGTRVLCVPREGFASIDLFLRLTCKHIRQF